MKRRQFLKNTSAAGLLTLVTPAGIFQTLRHKAVVGLEESFVKPPASARPQTWWHWMNGNVTKEGITLDLEAMQRVGIGGFQNFDAGTGIPEGPIKYLSPEWLELKKHAIREADRLGLEFTMHNCPGWSSSGGPWITPELSMQQITWSEAGVKGGGTTKLSLPQPFTNLNFYRDIAVLAFPTLKGDADLATQLKSASSSKGALNLKQWADLDQQGIAVPKGSAEQPGYILLEFKEPYELRSLSFIASVAGGGGFGGPAGGVTLEASDNGTQFNKVTTISNGQQVLRATGEAFFAAEVPATKARFFRLSAPDEKQYRQIRFSGAARLDDWMKKANYRFTGSGVTEKLGDGAEVAGSVIRPETIIDVTQYMDKNGVLNWKAPAGDWTVMRIGYTSMGTLNRSAPDTGVGLECDKYSAEAIEFHFNKMMESLLPTLRPLGAKGKVGLLIDSYEVGMQNWTPQFRPEFQRRMGYDLIKYLPAMTGRIVGSVDQSNRFLWDLRRAQADLMADNYYGKFTDLCHKNNIISYTQPYDRGPMEEMQIGSRIDTMVGEFWNSLSAIFQNNWTMRRTMKLSASIAHVNGQKVVGAESFTGEPESARWQEYPFALKGLGDKKMTEGLNRFIFHRFAHQPHPTAKPGMTMGPWGIHFDRTNTWWEPGKAWMQYLTRCQSLLQQGLFVADLAYYTGEHPGGYTEVSPEELNPKPLAGFDYDVINTEAIMRRGSVKDGRLTLPDGMSYRILIVQNDKGIRLELLQKLWDMVQQGLVLYGPKPGHLLGLKGASAEDRSTYDRLTAELWGSDAGPTTQGHSVGNGRVFWGQPIQSVLYAVGLKPDFTYSSRSGDAPISYIHRRIGDAEVYFIANQRRSQEDLVCSFRVAGRQPELWDADKGTMIRMSVFEQKEGETSVPLQLGPYGSAFVVFRSPVPASYLQSVQQNTDKVPALGTSPFPHVPRQLNHEAANTFTMHFWAKPEFNAMLSARGLMEGISSTWTDYYAVYPAAGEELYGKDFATAGLAVGRNGVAVWENKAGTPVFALAAPASITGWSHIALVYLEGVPSVYVNGRLIEKGKKSESNVVPGMGLALQAEGASYYNGDMSEPELNAKALGEAELRQLAAQQPPVRHELPVVEVSGSTRPSLLFWQDGLYTLRSNTGQRSSVHIKALPQPQELAGPWRVNFPPDLGAPAQITLPELQSLHKHEQPGVKYFSGTATYTKQFDIPASTLVAGTNEKRRVFLDLGQVEVIAEVTVNGRDMGTLWTRPYRVDITDAIKAGSNNVEIKVTNQWPNRLIGDEQQPDTVKYTSGGAGPFGALSSGAIQELPDWYKQGKPKPNNGRVAFTTWKHYTKDSPLLESGLVGPVKLLTVVEKPVVLA
ncbi:glycosyl hydrolase [Telluribacter humicola]|uniref:glycosyl hydrolase n=1 Tax=Telluribacter humicola TaxID=1720261 RepID=UPI001A956915|nr:glycosyl hydrolase [Telluribacter humicola]